MRADLHRQSGIALVMALLVVALATILAVSIMARSHADLRRAELQIHGEQALQYVFGAEQWVMQILYRDRRDSESDHLGEDWAVDLPPLPVDGGFITGKLEDLGGKFNLSNLVQEDGAVSTPHFEQFSRLLLELGLADQISAAAVVDFIDPDSEPMAPDGAEDSQYLLTQPPHRTPNRPLMALSELSLLRDFDPVMLPVLAPHVTTLPVRTALNINTASPTVIMSLAEDIAAPLAEQLAAEAAERGHESVQAFLAILGVQTPPALPLTLSSDWFLLTVRVDIGTMHLTMYSLLERLPDGRTRVHARQRTPW